MAGRPGAFHRKHGQNIRLYEEETVAHRVDSYNKAVVFSEQPIPTGSTFQVKLLDKGGGWAGSIVSAVCQFTRQVASQLEHTIKEWVCCTYEGEDLVVSSAFN